MQKLSSFGQGKKFGLKSHLRACCTQPFNWDRHQHFQISFSWVHTKRCFNNMNVFSSLVWWYDLFLGHSALRLGYLHSSLFHFQFLTDTFDALFAILMEHAHKYDKLVFDALVSWIFSVPKQLDSPYSLTLLCKAANNFCVQASHLSGHGWILTWQEASLVGQKKSSQKLTIIESDPFDKFPC